MCGPNTYARAASWPSCKVTRLETVSPSLLIAEAAACQPRSSPRATGFPQERRGGSQRSPEKHRCSESCCLQPRGTRTETVNGTLRESLFTKVFTLKHEGRTIETCQSQLGKKKKTPERWHSLGSYLNGKGQGHLTPETVTTPAPHLIERTTVCQERDQVGRFPFFAVCRELALFL